MHSLEEKPALRFDFFVRSSLLFFVDASFIIQNRIVVVLFEFDLFFLLNSV